MSTKIAKPLSLAIGAAFIGSLSMHQMAQANPAFSLNQLAAGYMTTGFGEGKCGEGKCGMAKVDSDHSGSVSKAEYEATGGKMFDAMDKDHNGSLSEAELAAGHKKGAEGSCGADKKHAEGSCGADKKKAEGSCGADKK